MPVAEAMVMYTLMQDAVSRCGSANEGERCGELLESLFEAEGQIKSAQAAAIQHVLEAGASTLKSSRQMILRHLNDFQAYLLDLRRAVLHAEVTRWCRRGRGAGMPRRRC